MQHMPILVITDIMSRVVPLVHGLWQTAAPNKGVLPRVGEPDEHEPTLFRVIMLLFNPKCKWVDHC
ncbi:unnamed protein product [Ectocarpus sp. CCAP 1310/34]|nr:unnamed protein product [Ectocarpus sp. CCAP 1310/34]